ncbi:hypothetical protein TRICI_005459 [Trichomonascus ciferrii]|uniref:Nucleolar complex protein 14 n=1 Tax=Trichomonascus ciferrii TaxID=44093 RepID=A0A642UUE5_9ASCO|nr:hypothetical protein TRICI_005459 [Trichomonascus ciferrii]
MGASQLKRLKASLKDQGLVGPSTSRKKKSKKVDSRKNNEAALRSIREAFNPFDVKVNRQKHEVLGRTVQGSKGRPELTKQMEEENRRQAFRAEKSRRNKAGGILDRRFGEQDKNMTLEEKMQERFTREMQTRSSKGSLFDLDDDEDEDDEFLSYGQSLSLKDDFDGTGLSADEDDEEIKQIRQKRMQLRDDADDEAEEPVRKKSKQEVMKEVIAKSKMHKLERQQAKEEDLAIIEELNEDGNIEELYRELSGLNRKSLDQKKVVGGDDADYDKEVRSLAFEKRAKPADRTKTTEELEKEADDKRKELERKRLARMNGELDESSDEEEIPEKEKGNTEGDENNDAREFGFDGSVETKTKPTDGESESEDDFGDILEEDMPADSSDESDPDQSSDDNADEDRVGSIVEIECPTSLSAMLSTLGSHDIEAQPQVVERILSKYHPRYAEGNKSKQGELCKALVDYILHLVDSDEEGLETVLNKFVSQVRRLAEDHSEALADHFREKIKDAETQLSSKLDGSVQVYPKTSTLMMFTLVGLIFSASDHFHPVVTPAQILICQTISQMPLRNLNDLYSGLYFCNVVLAYQKLANRFVPEVVSFLGKSLFSMLGNIGAKMDVQKTFLQEPTIKNMLTVDLDKLKDVKSAPLLLRENGKVSSSCKPRLLLETVSTVDRFMAIWKDKSAFVEVFGPLEDLISEIQHYHPSIKQVHEKMHRIMKLALQSRKPVTMQSHKPIPLKSLAPQFEENYNIDKKSYDPDTQRQEISKLKAQVKKERKGALRDIRKDNAFTARENNREKRERDREYHEKLARLERSIATEEGAEKNKYEREKMARKRSKR